MAFVCNTGYRGAFGAEFARLLRVVVTFHAGVHLTVVICHVVLFIILGIEKQVIFGINILFMGKSLGSTYQIF